jgi:hypothetical protein
MGYVASCDGTESGAGVQRAFTITFTYTQRLTRLQGHGSSCPAPLGPTGIKWLRVRTWQSSDAVFS